MPRRLVLSRRHCGPPDSGNGGYVAGTLAAALPDGWAEVSLRLPPPLEDELTLVTGDDSSGNHSRLMTGSGDVVAQARLVEDGLDPVEPVGFDDAAAASEAFPGWAGHPFPSCFTCGPDSDDGLRIFPGPLDDGTGRYAATWTPQPSIGPADLTTERVGLPVAWAALDCIGGWAGDLTDRVMVLARMTARFDDLPRLDEPHVVTARALSGDGRKTATASTLWDGDGRVVGTAKHLWVTVDPARFGADERPVGAS